MNQYDAIIVGFGKGGKTLAADLAAQGQTVALVERSAMMYGGTCINVGCIPSKSLVRSALASAQQPELDFAQKRALYTAAVAEKRRLTAMLRQKNYDKLNALPNVTIFTGSGSFEDAHSLRVRTADGETVIRGMRIFINTGSRSVEPPIAGLADNPLVYYSDTLMALTALPARLAIIGGGYIGLEFAAMYANFGAEVTVLQDGDVLIPREDEDISSAIKQALAAKGVHFLLGAAIERVETAQGQATIHYRRHEQEATLSADAVLVATGRRPNTDGLAPEAAGVDMTPRGAVQVDAHLHTSVPHIWAMGDVTGGLQFTYVSLDDYRIIRAQLAGETYNAVQRKNVPYSVFIDPPFSRVGLNEKEALAAGHRVKIARLPAAAIPKAQVLKQTTGQLKAVIDADTDKILGAMLFCEESYEMINTVKLAMDLDADYRVLRDQIFTHPTMSEALNDLFNL